MYLNDRMPDYVIAHTYNVRLHLKSRMMYLWHCKGPNQGNDMEDIGGEMWVFVKQGKEIPEPMQLYHDIIK